MTSDPSEFVEDTRGAIRIGTNKVKFLRKNDTGTLRRTWEMLLEEDLARTTFHWQIQLTDRN